MVADRSRMKQPEIAAHSSGRNGGDSRVFDWPARGVLQMMATATGGMIVVSSGGGRQSSGQVEIKLIRVLKANGKPQQVVRARRPLALDRGAVLDEAFDAAQRGGALPQVHPGGDGDRRLCAIADADGEHAAEAADHLPQGDLVAGVLREAGVKH